jgi:AcrR family transcriptional regulator
LTGQDDTVTAAPDGHKPLSHSPKSAKKRDSILQAATEIINVKGYALATMTEIAAALDLRDAALYYYFPNKQALVFACHQSSLERFERVLSQTNEDGGAASKGSNGSSRPCSWNPPATAPCSISAIGPIWTRANATRSPPAANT